MKFVHVSNIIIASTEFTLKKIPSASYIIIEWWDESCSVMQPCDDLILLKAARYRILYVFQRTYIGHH